MIPEGTGLMDFWFCFVVFVFEVGTNLDILVLNFIEFQPSAAEFLLGGKVDIQ